MVPAVPGTEHVEQALQALLAGFDPGRAPGRSALVRIDVVTLHGTDRFLVELPGSPPAPGPDAPSGEAPPPSPPRLLPFDPFLPDAAPAQRADVSVALDAADLGLLAAGELDLMDAFRSGRVRLSGNMALARHLPAWLGLETAP